MAINVQCSSCSHSWAVPSAKAGRTARCPECGAQNDVPKPEREATPARSSSERLRPGHRPRTERGIGDKAMLIGAGVVLVGVLALLGARMMRLMSDDNLVFDTSPVTDLAGSDRDTADEENSETLFANEKTEPSSPVEDDPTEAENDSESPADQSVAVHETTVGPLTEEGRRQVLSSLENVRVSLEHFPADTRGAVSDAVATAVRSALQRCRLNCVDSAETVMQIRLELQATEDTQDLVMSASLTMPQSGSPATLWERSGLLTEITDQAFNSGILPPALDRDTLAFFTDLRSQITEARREFDQ